MLEDLQIFTKVRILGIWCNHNLFCKENVLLYIFQKWQSLYLQLALAWQEDWRKVVAFSQREQQHHWPQLDDEWSAQNSVQCLRSIWFIGAPDSNSLALQRPHLFKTPFFPPGSYELIHCMSCMVLLTLEMALQFSQIFALVWMHLWSKQCKLTVIKFWNFEERLHLRSHTVHCSYSYSLLNYQTRTLVWPT